MDAFNKLTLKAKLILGFALPLLLLVIIAVTVNNSLADLLERQKWVNHTHEVIEKGEELTIALVNMETGLRGYLVSGDSEFLEPYDNGSAAFEEILAAIKEKVSDNEKQVGRLEQIEDLENDWQRNHVKVAIELRRKVNAGNAEFAEVQAFIRQAIGKEYMDAMRDYLDEFIGEEKGLIVVRSEEQKQAKEFTGNVTTIGTLIALLLGAVAAGLLIRNLLNILGGEPAYAIEVATRIANDNLKDLVCVKEKDTSSLLYHMKIMRDNLLASIERDRQAAAETMRIKMALDVCDTNVMMADADYNIVYMNDAVKGMMLDAEADLRKDLPNLDARNLMGQNIDVFHKNPAHQRGMLEKLVDTYRGSIVVGGRTFGLIATPIFDDNHARIGTVVEWDDKTERLAEEERQQQLAADNARIKQALDNVTANVMVADADRNIIYANDAVVNTLRDAQNDLRKDLPNFNVDTMVGGNIDQFHKNPSHQIKLLDSLTSTIRTKIVVGGRHMALIVNPVVDENGTRLGTVVEWNDQTVEVNIQNELDGIIQAANDGNLSERISMEDKDGFFATMSSGLNTLLDKTNDFVGDIGQVFEAMAEGDLTKSISTDYKGDFDRIKTNANNSITKLSEVLMKIQAASGAVRSSASEVAQGSDDLSRRTESQASSLEETASSMEEMTATVKQTSENATQANTLASEAKDQAQAGGAVVENAVTAMGEILESSNKINDIIGVIDEIAFQTNLLALNAAVEAARAGEQGRGFAVVAGEVRTLSQRSAAAAKEIKDLIRDSVGKVESGSKLVNQSGETLSEIVAAVEKVATMIEDVKNASIEQNSGIGQINQAITQMDEMTQQNAALVEETSAASRSMSEEATNMNNMISFFRMDGSAAYRGASMPVAAPEPIQTYQPSAPAALSSGSNGAASFSSDDEWEDF